MQLELHSKHVMFLLLAFSVLGKRVCTGGVGISKRASLRRGGLPFSAVGSNRSEESPEFKRLYEYNADGRRPILNKNKPTGDVKMKGTFLNTNYSEKDQVKALGARWDPAHKKWFVPPGRNLSPFSKWLQPLPVVEDSISEFSSEFQEGQAAWSASHEGARLGALQVDTQRYVHPSIADRSKEFVCMECGQKVIIKRGEIRVHHFSHYYNTSGLGCNYYDHPGESQCHKDAKHHLVAILQQRRTIKIHWQCSHNRCGEMAFYRGCGGSKIDGSGFTTIKYEEGDTASIEFRDPGGKYVADVALRNGNSVKYIFEIRHSHATTTTVRPEPWFEIPSQYFFDSGIEHGDCIHLKCERETHDDETRYCKPCRFLYISTPDWVLKIPRLIAKIGSEGNWHRTDPCIQCGRGKYNPVFLKGFRQVCKICLGTLTNEIKHRFQPG